jgi:hypothetical protein
MHLRKLIPPLVASFLVVPTFADSKSYNLNCNQQNIPIKLTLFNGKQSNTNIINFFKDNEAIPFETYYVDYNGDGIKEKVSIGAINNYQLFCEEECETLVDLFYQKYIKFGGPTNNWINQFIEMVDNLWCSVSDGIFNTISNSIYNMVCSVWEQADNICRSSNPKSWLCDISAPPTTCFSGTEACSEDTKKYYTIVALDLTDKDNPKVILSYPISFLPKSGFLVVQKDKKAYILFAHVIQNDTNSTLYVYSLPLREKINYNELIRYIIFTSEDNIKLVEGKLYSTAIDLDNNEIDDIALIPFFKQESSNSNNWKSYIAVMDVTNDTYAFWQKRSIKKIADLNPLTPIVYKTIKGKPYILFGSTDKTQLNIRNNYYHPAKAKFFSIIPLCKNQNQRQIPDCNVLYTNNDINASNIAFQLKLNFKNLTIDRYPNESDCKEFIENYRGLKFELEEQGGCIPSAKFYWTYKTTDGKIIFEAVHTDNSNNEKANYKACGFILDIGQIIGGRQQQEQQQNKQQQEQQEQQPSQPGQPDNSDNLDSSGSPSGSGIPPSQQSQQKSGNKPKILLWLEY